MACMGCAIASLVLTPVDIIEVCLPRVGFSGSEQAPYKCYAFTLILGCPYGDSVFCPVRLQGRIASWGLYELCDWIRSICGIPIADL